MCAATAASRPQLPCMPTWLHLLPRHLPAAVLAVPPLVALAEAVHALAMPATLPHTEHLSRQLAVVARGTVVVAGTPVGGMERLLSSERCVGICSDPMLPCLLPLTCGSWQACQPCTSPRAHTAAHSSYGPSQWPCPACHVWACTRPSWAFLAARARCHMGHQMAAYPACGFHRRSSALYYRHRPLQMKGSGRYQRKWASACRFQDVDGMLQLWVRFDARVRHTRLSKPWCVLHGCWRHLPVLTAMTRQHS
jgi:hypothetical protein